MVTVCVVIDSVRYCAFSFDLSWWRAPLVVVDGFGRFAPSSVVVLVIVFPIDWFS